MIVWMLIIFVYNNLETEIAMISIVIFIIVFQQN